MSLSIAQETIEETKAADAEETIDIADERIEIEGRKNALSIGGGMPGFSVDYSRKISEKFTAKLRYNFFKIEDYEYGKVDVSGNDVSATISGESNTIDLLLEYLPFKNSSFKLVGGLGFINEMNFNIDMVYEEEVIFGDVVLTKEDYGDLNLGFAWEGVAPYLGVGFGRAVPKGRLGFGIEVGSYFSSSPDISLAATKLLAPTADQVEEVQETFKSWKFIPLLQFRLAYAF